MVGGIGKIAQIEKLKYEALFMTFLKLGQRFKL